MFFIVRRGSFIFFYFGLVFLGGYWRHLISLHDIVLSHLFLGSLFTGSLRRITFRLILRVGVFALLFDEALTFLWYKWFGDGWRHSGVSSDLWVRLVSLLSFLGWSQCVEAFSFHSLSCFCGIFGADSVGKKIGKGGGLMCVIDSDVE